jgi:hypothetical protein
VLSGRGLCDELITRPEESYRLWCVVVCDLETTKILVNEEEGQDPLGGCRAKRKKTKKQTLVINIYREIPFMLFPQYPLLFYYLLCSELLS